MDTSQHNIDSLFQQLGLPSQPPQIQQFIATHQPLPCGTLLSDAGFWSKAQITFLQEGLQDDSDWTEAIDQLDVQLRQKQVAQTRH